jgi:hypothetical protein
MGTITFYPDDAGRSFTHRSPPVTTHKYNRINLHHRENHRSYVTIPILMKLLTSGLFFSCFPHDKANIKIQYISNYPDAGYPDRLGPSGNIAENYTKLICLEITGYRIEYSTVKCYGCLELQIRRGRKV